MAGDKNTFMKYIIIILVILGLNMVGGYIIAKKILDYTYSTDELDTLTGEEEKGENFDEDSAQIGIAVPLEPINLNPFNSSGEIFTCDIILEAKDEMLR